MSAVVFTGFARNNLYANRTIYEALKGMGEADFTALRPGFFPSLAETLNHNYLVDVFYMDALVQGGEGRAIFERPNLTDVSALSRAQANVDARLVAFCAGLAETDLASEVHIPRQEGMTVERVDALLSHLFQHQIHHRGQAHVQIGDAGTAPPQLDEYFLEYMRAPLAAEVQKTS